MSSGLTDSASQPPDRSGPRSPLRSSPSGAVNSSGAGSSGSSSQSYWTTNDDEKYIKCNIDQWIK